MTATTEKQEPWQDIAQVYLSIHGNPPENPYAENVYRLIGVNGEDLTTKLVPYKCSVSRKCETALSEVELVIRAKRLDLKLESVNGPNSTKMTINGVDVIEQLMLNSYEIMASPDIQEIVLRFDAIILTENPATVTNG